MKKEKDEKYGLADYIKLGFGFYIGFNLGRVLKRMIIITNVSQ